VTALDRSQLATTAAPTPQTSAPVRLAIVLGTVATTVSALGSWIPSLWGDEAATALSAERSLPSLFRMLGNVDAVHGTYYLLMHAWVSVFGASPFSLRFPSAIAAGIAVAGVVLLAHRLAGTRAALFAGLVCGMLPRVTYMGEEARGYALSAACVTWLTYLLVRILQNNSSPVRRRLWALYAIGVALCAYVFMFSLLVLVAHAATVAYSRRDLFPRWARWSAGGIALAAPVLFLGFSERAQIAFLSARSAATFLSSTVTPWFGNQAGAALGWGVIVVIVGVTIRAWWRARRTPVRPRPAVSLVLLGTVWLVGPLVILLSINIADAVYSSRYLSFCAPAAALLIGFALSRISSRWIAVAALAAITATSGFSYLHDRTPYAKNGSDWAEASAAVAAHARAGDGIIFDESSRPSKRTRLAMRTYPAAFRGLHDIELATPWWETVVWHDETSPLANVSDRLIGLQTVWVLEYKTPGRVADNYDVAALRSRGFAVDHSYSQYSSELLEFTRESS
jgi:mannosyltransferase